MNAADRGFAGLSQAPHDHRCQRAVNNAASHRLEKVHVWNRIKIFRQIRIDHIGIAPADQPVCFLDRITRTTARTISMGTVLKVRFKDWFQHKLGGSLPLISGGLASASSLSRPAQTSLALRPLDCSTAQGGLCHEASAQPVTQTNRSSATRPIDNYLGGSFFHWWYAPSGRTEISGLSIRTTNAIERLHEEFKRRIKTQTALPSAETAATLFWALMASG